MAFLRKMAMKRQATFAAALTLSTLLAANTARAAFDIQLNFDGTVTAQQQAIFNQAATTWESLITGYQPGISVASLVISASTPAIDGAGGILGQAGPTNGTNQGGFLIATTGQMQFDSADVANLIADGSFGDVVLHEMAHVMGFGTLWTQNNVYVNNSGLFTGVNALTTYRQEYNQPLALGVPVELGGGNGTANGHWDEVDGGSGPTGIADVFGRDKEFELMTGWLNAPTYISRTTIASFRDIGYTTISTAVVPEAGTLPLIGLGLFTAGAPLLARRRRNRTAA